MKIGLRGTLLLFVLGAIAPAQAQVVISQVYGGGGNSGATLRSDFIELHNNGTSAVSLAGWSVQYASSTGSSWQVTPLGGSIAPGGYYLVKQADGSGGSVDLPAPDATGTIAMAAGAGKVALSSATAALSGTCPLGNVDFVGFGSAANCAEGSAPTATLNNTTAALRNDGGCTDSDNNAADFATGAPAPRNGASAPKVCAGGGQPVATIADVSLAEGNAGSTVFAFELTLSEPAGPGGVSFDIATADGSAQVADGDYVARRLSAQVIAQGQQSYTFEVQVNGDTRSEPNETFLVQVANISGALPGTLQATGTIVNDDIVATPIHAIQGSGAVSPLVGQTVYTTGIVTGRRTNGFFVQTPDAEADANPATSQAIFVFTGAAPSAAATVGNRVQVQGTVIEFVPSADPNQPPLTELGGSVSVLALSSGNALPTPVELTASFPDPDGAFDQLERVEGMRVTVPSLTVSGPTLGNVSEVNATATSNGIFHAVVTGVPRAYREPGIQLPDPAPAGIPRWDTNPELLAVSSAALGGERLDLAAGCVVTGATGPLDYTFRRYTLYPESTPASACNGADQPRPAVLPTADDVSVASYNMERFFDDSNDPSIGEPVLNPVAYQGRLNKASLAIRDFLNAPDIIGVVEMENLATLQTLATRINQDAVAAGQPDPAYVGFLEEGNDVGGIDVGFLVKTADVGPGIARVQVLSVVQEGKATTWIEPGGGASLLNDRPPLRLQAIVHFNDGRQLPLTVIVVHNRSLNGAAAETPAGERIRAKRQAQAEFVARLVQARQVADPQEKIVVLGDFNAFEFNDGYVDALNTIAGTPSPDSATLVPGDGADLVDPDLLILTLLNPAEQSYSYVFDGQIQSLDHILVNQALVDAPQLDSLVVTHARINADFPAVARNDFNAPTRLSDHDPTLVLLRLEPRELADLEVAAAAVADPVNAGQTAAFIVDVRNNGPQAAAFAALAFVFDRAVEPTVSLATGWSCADPVRNATTTVTCTLPSLAAGNAYTFNLAVETAAADAGSTLQLAAAASSLTEDPVEGNNGDVAQVAIVAPPAADLALALDGPDSVPPSTFSVGYSARLSNLGTLPAAQPAVVFSGNTMASTTRIVAPAGWRCANQGSARQARLRCSSAVALAPGAEAVFSLQVNARPNPGNRLIEVIGTASTPTADAQPGNDTDRITTVITR
jgi:hypothetical protein